MINKLFSNILIPTVGVCYDNAVVGFRVKEQREEKEAHMRGLGSEPRSFSISSILYFS
jgi:hypothetical protein